MLKKYKILLISIILTAGGITLVLSIWLYGSYQSRKQFFLGASEHILFEVLQKFYKEKEDDLEKDSVYNRSSRFDRLADTLVSKYPTLQIDSVKKILEDQGFSRKSLNGVGKDADDGKKRFFKRLSSSFAVRSIVWNQVVIDTLANRFKAELDERNMYVPFKLYMINYQDGELERAGFHHERFSAYKTRPLLIDPLEDKYIELDYDNPWKFLLTSIGWQLFLSIFLVSALIATFFYLLGTIRKQNQIATLRRAFVNNMTHELKTPVSTVMAAIEAIQRYGAKDDKVRMERYLNISRHELEHLSDMIERVLQVDVAETNGVQLDKTWFSPAMLLEECIENAKIFAKKPITVYFNNEAKDELIFADQAHVKNLLSNLFDNALKYAKEELILKISIHFAKDIFNIRIEDNGIGIPNMYQKNVFDLFFRVPSGEIHSAKGFGLGLAYVKQVVTQHQGTIELESQEGVGSTFVIKLPKESK